ncbi:phosphodiester glycosidase family protein [Patescibacteria group bacterium]|nr:phosphodiester glycosidase family protein [Patescibacteria group bacterium]MBP9709866.1 phosphodiester glycosidase family protein [Patescibacteria group bacterium]
MKRLLMAFGLVAGISLFGAGCLSLPPVVVEPAQMVERSLEVTRQAFGSGIEWVRANVATSTAGQLWLFGFEQEKYRFAFAAARNQLRMSEWRDTYASAVAGINGVYFMEDMQSAGLFMGDGHWQVKRLFDADKSALMKIGDQFEILDTATSGIRLAELKGGAQTYPILIKDGKEMLTRDTGKEARRSWVGTDRDGRVWLGVLSDGEISLYGLMKRLMEMGINWDMVVNLDGGPSTGIFVKGEEGDVLKETLGGVPNVLLVERK